MGNGPNTVSPEVLLGVAALAVLVMEVLVRNERWRERSLARLAAKVGLEVPGDLRTELRREAASRTRTRIVGASGGGAAVSIWALLAGGVPVDATLWGMLTFSAAVAGLALAAAVRALALAAAPAAEGTRVARASSPALPDYVAPIELVGSRVVAAMPLVASVGLVVAALAFAGTSPMVLVRSGALWVALGVPVTLLVSELGGRRLLDKPQIAASPLQLAWRDAVRAQVLRDLVSLPLAAGVYGTFAVLTMVANVAPEAFSVALKGGLGLLAVGILVVAFVAGRSRPEQWFRRRLWPDSLTDNGGPA